MRIIVKGAMLFQNKMVLNPLAYVLPKTFKNTLLLLGNQIFEVLIII